MEDNFADYVTAIQLMEHIPKVVPIETKNGWKQFHPFIFLLNEVYRVAKDGATLEVHVPTPTCEEFHQDPNHINGIVDKSWIYFDSYDFYGLREAYGINAQLVSTSIVDRRWYKEHYLTVWKGASINKNSIFHLPNKSKMTTRFFAKLKRYMEM